MKLVYFLFLLFGASLSLAAQETLNIEETYRSHKLIYNANTNEPLTGVVQNIKKNGHIITEKYCENGYATKYLIYYNIYDRQVIADEILYFPQSFAKRKEIHYSSDGTRVRNKDYNEKGEMVLSELYENNKLLESCEYKNNKRDGKRFCYSKDGEPLTHYYEKGKLVK